MQFQPLYIVPENQGLIKNKKPFLITENAFQRLNDAYCWRNRIKKREGLKFLGRLRRNLIAEAMGNISSPGAGTVTVNIFTGLGLSEPNASIQPGDETNISIVIGAPISQTLTDTTGTGIMTFGAGPITQANINYATGDLTLVFSGAAGASAATFTGAYFPGLPCMGIAEYETIGVNLEDTIYFDTKYAYLWNGAQFVQLGTAVWSGDDADFFWTTNYRGSNAFNRLFFATNFISDASNPIRYYDGAAWTDFGPDLDAVPNVLRQARILIPYYGRLLALNTYEGLAAGVAQNFFNRCRFSQIGNPLEAEAWRSDIFGRGGFIDAPVNEEITSAIFYKNVLIVFFEQTTWQLRYVGEYGLPFIWERISSDFGCESPFSPILFDKGVFAVGDKAIIATDSNFCDRMDLDIPDEVFNFNNTNDGPARVAGVRDYQKELVSWCYRSSINTNTYPDAILLYNYRNNTWANFRTNCTAMGTQRIIGDGIVLWSRDDIFWDDENVYWNDVGQIEDFPAIVIGNQHGYISWYMKTSQDEKSLKIESIDLTADPLRIVVNDHNLFDDEIIYITDMKFLDAAMTSTVDSDLNGRFYKVEIVDSDTLDLYGWDQTVSAFVSNFTFTTPTTSVYTGNGSISLIPRMSIITKDFNPFADKGNQFKSSFIDFQTDASPHSVITVNSYVNSSFNEVANLPVWNPEVESSLNQEGLIYDISNANPCVIESPDHGLLNGRTITIDQVVGMELAGVSINDMGEFTVTFIDTDTFSINLDTSLYSAYVSGGNWTTTDFNPFYVPGSAYAWHRFYSNVFGQYINFELTYDDILMAQTSTHNSSVELNAMILWVKPAGRLVI